MVDSQSRESKSEDCLLGPADETSVWAPPQSTNVIVCASTVPRLLLFVDSPIHGPTSLPRGKSVPTAVSGAGYRQGTHRAINPQPMKTRRTHNKTRFGCGDCKRRRIKVLDSYPLVSLFSSFWETRVHLTLRRLDMTTRLPRPVHARWWTNTGGINATMPRPWKHTRSA